MTYMKTTAATLSGPHRPWQIVELEVDRPGEHEVLVRWVASGMCMSDQHLRHGGVRPRFPIIGGHEGAGYVEEVGVGVTRVGVGDAVVGAFIPSCGRCRWCATGKQALCDLGAAIVEGTLPGNRFVFHRDGLDYGAFGGTATFSHYATVSEYSLITITDDVPLLSAAIVGCAVPTGWGSAVYAADVAPGDTVVVVGTGGVGMNAVQGAGFAGAKHVIAVDPVAFKLDVARSLGASHTAGSAQDAFDLVMQLTHGVGADKVIVTVAWIEGDLINQALRMVAKAGTLVITSWADSEESNLRISSVELTAYDRKIVGSLYGSGNPNWDVVRLLDLYRSGDLKLDELITQTYSLDEINSAYDDLAAGKNVRGVILHES